MEFYRDTLIRNIELALRNAQKEDLPATIKEVYAFGGILRDKEKLHDFDSVFLCEQTSQQKERWERFRRNFSSVYEEDKEISCQQLRDLLEPYFKQDIPLSKAVMIGSVSKALSDYGIEPRWAACFSWTEIFFPPIGVFVPDLGKVLRKLLFKGIRGIQAWFEDFENFRKGHRMLSAENFQLAWSSEMPDIKKNLNMPPEAKRAFIVSELRLFQKQLLPLKEQMQKLQTDLISIFSGTGLDLDFNKLNSKHTDISFDEKEPIPGLLIKCEQARKELRGYHEEIAILSTLKYSIEDYQRRKSDPFFSSNLNYTMKELVTLWTILRTPKYESKEEKIREVLSDLRLPEDYVVTVRTYGTLTRYELEPDSNKRKESLTKADEEETKNKYLKPLNRIARRYDKNFYVHIDFLEGRPISLNISYHQWSFDESEDQKKEILSKLQKAGFKLGRDKYSINANKTIKVESNATIKELEKTVEKAFAEYPQ
jgi:hypothetical protein